LAAVVLVEDVYLEVVGVAGCEVGGGLDREQICDRVVAPLVDTRLGAAQRRVIAIQTNIQLPNTSPIILDYVI